MVDEFHVLQRLRISESSSLQVLIRYILTVIWCPQFSMHYRTHTRVLPLPLKGNLKALTFDELVLVLLQEEQSR